VNKLAKHTAGPAGVDVSQETLDVAVRDHDGNERTAQFDNTATGHRQLIRWLTKSGKAARVVLEATGVYSLDLAVALHAAKRVEVMVINPRAARKFAEACLQRSSTDATMAVALREYAARMEFVPWVPPAESVRALRAIARRLATLTAERASEQNRAHAAAASAATPAVVVNDIAVNVRHLQRRLAELHRQALALIENDLDLTRAYRHLTSVRGIAAISAIQLLGELLVLPADMTVRQWVAHSGLARIIHEP
jgi:transposase